jgi:hypothetical protein
MKASAILLCGALSLLGCAGTLRIYQTPLSPTEGESMVPALLSAAQQQGLRAWRGIGQQGAIVDLGNGVYAGWQESMNHRDFELHITLPGGIPDAEVEGQMASAKTHADQIWASAVELRRTSAPR